MCAKCGKALPQGIRVGFRDSCSFCKAELHTCEMCRFYKPGAHYDCSETVEYPVTDKGRANFCEWFSIDFDFSNKAGKGGASQPSPESAKAVFDALFKP